MSRRDFLSRTATGVVSFTLIKDFKNKKKRKKITQKGEIIYRKLGETNIKMPVINMGVMNSDNPEVVKKVYDVGIRHFDTAFVYQDGNNEKMVGDVIKKLDVRDKVIIGTKIPVAFGRKWVRTITELEELKKTEGENVEDESTIFKFG